jgi:hypothetical protein
VGILAADPNAKREPTRRDLRDRRELAGNRHRVAERKQVQPHIHRQLNLSDEQ